MQLVSSRIWTRVTMPISYDDNHYTTATSLAFILRSYLYFYIIISLEVLFIYSVFFHYPSEYNLLLNRSFWTIDRTQLQGGTWSNGNEGVIHTTQISRTGASQSDAVSCQTQDTPYASVGDAISLTYPLSYPMICIFFPSSIFVYAFYRFILILWVYCRSTQSYIRSKWLCY